MDVTVEDVELLKKILDYESTMDEYSASLGWTWLNLGVYSSTIHKLLVKGLVRVTYKSRSSTNFLLTDAGKEMAAAGPDMLAEPEKSVDEEPVLDISGLFSDIVGYEDIKELLRESLQLDKPIHILLYGPPSLAKTMFIWDIERAGGEAAMPLLGSATSHAGLWDLIAEKRPKWLLVDELEKMNLTDMAALLSIMEKGRIIRAKVGRRLDEKVKIWVVATANRIHRLPPELLSRFAVCEMGEYGATQFKNVVTNVLVSHEDTSPDDAYQIAMRLLGRTHDVRDAVRVARLAKRVGVQRAIELLVR